VVFASYAFAFGFLPIVLSVVLGTSAIGHRTAAKLLLFIASLVFYAWWNPPYLAFLLAILAFNYVIVSWLVTTPPNKRFRRAVMIGGVVANIATLLYFKYWTFLVGQVGAVLHEPLEPLALAMPLGISFIVFQKIALLVDAYSGQIKRLGILEYGLFVSFFPQLISGPIVHHREVIPQFESENSVRYSATGVPVAIAFVVIGAFKKVVIADSFSSHVAAIFDSQSQVGFIAAWEATVSYTLQVYFDFSGYSDMAIGLGLLFGVRLPFNFNSPLKATSPIDYWGRWHITLTRFLTAYIYNPLALRATRRRVALRLPIKRSGVMTPAAFAALLALPTFVTMFVAGAWHGAGYQFMVFGVLHGVYLVANHGWRVLRTREHLDLAPSTASVAACRAATLVAVILAIPFFRAESVSGAWSIVSSMLGVHGLSAGASAFERSFVFLIVAVFIASQVLPNTQEVLHDALERVTSPLAKHPGETSISRGRSWPRIVWRPTIWWACALGAVAWYVILHLARPSEFLYFQF